MLRRRTSPASSRGRGRLRHHRRSGAALASAATSLGSRHLADGPPGRKLLGNPRARCPGACSAWWPRSLENPPARKMASDPFVVDEPRRVNSSGSPGPPASTCAAASRSRARGPAQRSAAFQPAVASAPLDRGAPLLRSPRHTGRPCRRQGGLVRHVVVERHRLDAQLLPQAAHRTGQSRAGRRAATPASRTRSRLSGARAGGGCAAWLMVRIISWAS